MRTILIILLTFNIGIIFCQEELPVFQKHSMSWNYWPDTIIERQIEYWDNGNIKTEYKYLHDSIRLCKEYYESGNLKLTAEVYQQYVIDTFMIEDPITFALKVEIRSGFSDFLHGKYKEYYDGKGYSALVTGNFCNNKKNGEWTKASMGKLIVATYNDNGKLDGPYFEYYHNGANPRANIKWEGQYSVVNYTYEGEDPMTFEITQLKRSHSVRSGIWKYYSRDGELLQTIKYDWLKK